MMSILGLSAPVLWYNTPLSYKPGYLYQGLQDDCVRGPCSPCQPGRAVRHLMSAGTLNSIVCCTMMTKSRQGFVICDLHSQLALQGIIVGAPSLLVSATGALIIERKPRCGVDGAGCPPGPSNLLLFVAQLLSQTFGKIWDRGHLPPFSLCVQPRSTSQSCLLCPSPFAHLLSPDLMTFV